MSPEIVAAASDWRNMVPYNGMKLHQKIIQKILYATQWRPSWNWNEAMHFGFCILLWALQLYVRLWWVALVHTLSAGLAGSQYQTQCPHLLQLHLSGSLHTINFSKFCVSLSDAYYGKFRISCMEQVLILNGDAEMLVTSVSIWSKNRMMISTLFSLYGFVVAYIQVAHAKSPPCISDVCESWTMVI